jgi:hypothetical protein
MPERRSKALQRAIAHAESILPGRRAPDNEHDPRWQATIRVGEFIEDEPEAVWEFARRWGKHAQADLRAAVATCLLEHLLEHHFDLLFTRVRDQALASVRFADTLSRCWSFGQSKLPGNAKRLEKLKRDLRRRKHRRAI